MKSISVKVLSYLYLQSMLSLRRLANEETLRAIDFSERYPSMEARELTIPGNLTNRQEIIHHALRSHDNSLIMWGLNHYPILCEHDRRALQILPAVSALFYSQSRIIEFSAVTAVYHIIHKYARNVAGQLLTVLLERINDNPAVEYVHCLAKLIPFFTDVTMSSCITPLFDKYLEKADPYHYAIGELLMHTSFESLRMTTDQFSRFIISPVIVNHYIGPLLRASSKSKMFTEDWCTRVYPNQLLQAANINTHIKEGVMNIILSMNDIISQKYFLGYALTLIQWAHQNDDLAVLLLSKADEIVTPKTVDLFPKLRELMTKVCQTAEFRLRLVLPRIIASNPSVFMVGDTNFQHSVLGFGRDRCPEVRAAFLDSFCHIFGRNKSQSVQDALFSLFIEFFQDPVPAVRLKLCSSVMYSSLGQSRLYHVCPNFTKLLSSVTKWRNVADCVHTFMSFPTDIVRYAWRDVTPIVFNAVENSPKALAACCQGFCCRVISVIDDESNAEFTEMLVSKFAKNSKFAMRQIYCRLVAAVALPNQTEVNIDRLWIHVPPLATDEIASVRVSLLPNLFRLKQFYFTHDNTEREKEIVDLFLSFKDSSDPYIANAFDENWPKFNSPIVKPEPSSNGKQQMSVEVSKSMTLSKKDLPSRQRPVGVLASASETRAVAGAGSSLMNLSIRKAKATRFVSVATGMSQPKIQVPMFRKALGAEVLRTNQSAILPSIRLKE